ncbi:PEP-CTERM sorting domain-containing protein [Phycisphaeraceae bacterium D3-23]
MFGHKTLALATLGLVSTLTAGTASADHIIGWNMVGQQGIALGAGDTAGAPGWEQANWNNHSSSGQGPGSVPLNDLVNSAGGATDVDVVSWSQSTNNSWSYFESATPDQTLLADFADTDPVITFANVNDHAADGYTVIVYYGNNEWNFNGGGTLDVNGSTQTIASNDAFSATGYVLNDGSNQSNYAVFTGISGDTLTVSLDAAGNDGISAIQIVDIPEPGSLALLGLGGLLIVRRRRA